MPQLIDKKNKIILYVIFLFLLSTTSGKFNNEKEPFSSIIKANVYGLSNDKNLHIMNQINDLQYQNILNINKEEIIKIIEKYNIVEEYNIKKIYPSLIKINIKPTKFIARILDKHQLLVGTNGKLIKQEFYDKELPYIDGQFKTSDFIILKENIIQSKLSFSDLKILYFFPLGRWDILTTDNILIKLPRENLIQSLNLAHTIIKGGYFNNKNFIDLRIDSQLITN